LGQNSVNLIIDMIKANNSLKELILENMNFDFNGLTDIQKACSDKSSKLIITSAGNCCHEQLLNVWTHVFGLFVSL